VGYSAYCPSKYAVKGLADCLRNEVRCAGSSWARAVVLVMVRGQIPFLAWGGLATKCELDNMAETRRRRSPELPTVDGAELPAAGLLLIAKHHLPPMRPFCLLPALFLGRQLQGTQVKVSFAQPPDTDTPGFAEENKHKVRGKASSHAGQHCSGSTVW
jgi:hypothetical protein